MFCVPFEKSTELRQAHLFVYSKQATKRRKFRGFSFFLLLNASPNVYTHKTFIGRNGIQFASLFASRCGGSSICVCVKICAS